MCVSDRGTREGGLNAGLARGCFGLEEGGLLIWNERTGFLKTGRMSDLGSAFGGGMSGACLGEMEMGWGEEDECMGERVWIGEGVEWMESGDGGGGMEMGDAGERDCKSAGEACDELAE